jgi:hypothetical protein
MDNNVYTHSFVRFAGLRPRGFAVATLAWCAC